MKSDACSRWFRKRTTGWLDFNRLSRCLKRWPMAMTIMAFISWLTVPAHAIMADSAYRIDALQSFLADQPDSNGNPVSSVDLADKVTAVVLWNPPDPNRTTRPSTLANPFTFNLDWMNSSSKYQLEAFVFLEKWRRLYAERGFQVFAIMPARWKGAIQELFKTKDLNWRLIFSEHPPKELYGLQSGFTNPPTFLLFGRDGRLIEMHTGNLDLEASKREKRGGEAFWLQWLINEALIRSEAIRWITRDELLTAQMQLTPDFDFDRYSGAYMWLYHRVMHNRLHQNEFEFPKARASMVTEMKARAAAMDLDRELILHRYVEIGDYNGERQRFPIRGIRSPFYQNSNYAQPFPTEYGIDLNSRVWNEVGLDGIPMDPKAAAVMIKSKTNERGEICRTIHAILRYRLGPMTNPRSRQIIYFMPILLSVSFYPDEWATDPLYVFSPRVVPKVASADKPGSTESNGDIRDQLTPVAELKPEAAKIEADRIAESGLLAAVMGDSPQPWHWWACNAAYAASSYEVFQKWLNGQKKAARNNGFKKTVPAPSRALWQQFRLVAEYRPDLFLWVDERQALDLPKMKQRRINALTKMAKKYPVEDRFFKLTEDKCY